MAFQALDDQDQALRAEEMRKRTMQNLQPPAGGFGAGGTRQSQYGLAPSASPVAQQEAGGYGAGGDVSQVGPRQAESGVTPGAMNTVGQGPRQQQYGIAPGQASNAPAGAPNQPGGAGAFSQDWFMQQVAGKPYNQQTLLDLESALGSVGSKLTPANSAGERTKIWDPTSNQWVRVGFGEGKPVWIPQGADSGGGGGAGFGGGAGGGGFNDQIRQMLMEQLKGAGKPISADDPQIAGELQAQERGLERNRQDRRAAMAERAAAQGLAGSGAFDADVAQGFEDKGAAMSGLRSQLFGRELQNRRQQMTQMLNMALQSGDAESARALQLQLGQMDIEMRKLGLGEQARQWNDQFGLEAGKFQYGKDKDLALFGAGG